jgi:DNA-binding transcriptional ArsR family regulator
MKQGIIILIILFFVSCNEKEVVLSKDIIEKEKFIEVLKDKALAEAALNVNVKNAPGEKFDSVYNFNVYKENGITRSQYDSTMKYYSAKPAEFKEMMEVVLEKLNVEKAKR